MKLNYNIINALSCKRGEAFYILDTKQFQNNYTNLLAEFRKYYINTNIAYSYKTNYIPRLCHIVSKMGGYAEVVSQMEYELALKIGVPHERIIFNGPYKDISAVRELLLNGGIVNIDTVSELKKIVLIAKNNPNCKLKIGIRCNFDVGDGNISRFGVDTSSEDFQNSLRIIHNTQNIILQGIHCHFASRNLEVWKKRILEMTDNVFLNVKEDDISFIDIGGGLYGNMEDSLKQQFNEYIPSFSEYAQIVAKKVADTFKNENCPELIIEPGSALAGDCMKFVSKVESIKNVRGKNIATLLGSIYNINPTLNKKNPPITIFSKTENDLEYEDLDFGGFTCIESDYLYRHYSGKLGLNSFVVFDNVGSYSVVLKPPFILPNFPIIEIDEQGNEKFLVKKAERFDDIFQTYNFSFDGVLDE